MALIALTKPTFRGVVSNAFYPLKKWVLHKNKVKSPIFKNKAFLPYSKFLKGDY